MAWWKNLETRPRRHAFAGMKSNQSKHTWVNSRYFHVVVVRPVKAKADRQSPLAPAGKTEISAAPVQPFVLISCKAVKRKNRALTGAKVTS